VVGWVHPSACGWLRITLRIKAKVLPFCLAPVESQDFADGLMSRDIADT
jgi:hypothetical protein